MPEWGPCCWIFKLLTAKYPFDKVNSGSKTGNRFIGGGRKQASKFFCADENSRDGSSDSALAIVHQIIEINRVPNGLSFAGFYNRL